MVDFKKLGKKIKRGRQIDLSAMEFKDLIEGEFKQKEMTESERTRFWKKLLDDIWQSWGTSERSAMMPMEYKEAQTFYRTHELSFGKYKGRKLIDIPPDYLEWLDAQPDFRRDLHRFLCSQYWKTTHGQEE